jgi:hypothetical protein
LFSRSRCPVGAACFHSSELYSCGGTSAFASHFALEMQTVGLRRSRRMLYLDQPHRDATSGAGEGTKPHWVHEVKHDGRRLQIHAGAGWVRTPFLAITKKAALNGAARGREVQTMRA